MRDALGFPARTLSGDEEARLTFAGATSLRDDDEPLLVIDVGGGSTELVLGARRRGTWHASTQIGVVRHSERHLHSDPPTACGARRAPRDVRTASRLPDRADGRRRRSPSPAPRRSARRSTSDWTLRPRAHRGPRAHRRAPGGTAGPPGRGPARRAPPDARARSRPRPGDRGRDRDLARSRALFRPRPGRGL